MYMDEQNNENPALYNASKNKSIEIFMKQSVGKCNQINF